MESLSDSLTNEQFTQYKEAFTLFDKHGLGTIPSSEVPTVMRAAGRNPTEQEAELLVSEADPESKGTVNLETFLELMGNHMPHEDSTAELLEAFQFFDKDGDGYLSTSELKFILSNSGQDLSDIEVEELIKLGDENNTGIVKYVELANVMTLS